MIKTKKYSFANFNYLPKGVSAYIENDPSIKEFVGYSYSLDSFDDVIAAKKKETINRKLLVEALHKQYEGIDLDKSPQIKNNIDKLLNSNAFTVTTGHQLCLFTGPLYFVYKIFSTINLAEDLSQKYPNQDFVPVFWMATEDHDFEEVNHFSLFNKKISWNRAEIGAVGRMDLRGIEEPLAELEETLGNAPYAADLIEWYKKAYFDAPDLASATRSLAHELFAKYGLVVLDGDDPLLKSLFADIMANDVLEETSFEIVNAQNSKLGEAYKVQVNPREINLFYLNDFSRERIIKVDEEHITIGEEGAQLAKKELIAQIKTHPELFSPNVILRPLYQEKILPNLAYIGGPGELSYWFQLKTLFHHYHVNYPLVVLRNSALWVNKTLNRKLEKLPCGIEELNQDKHALLNQMLKKTSDKELELEQEKNEIIDIFDSISAKADEIDPTLVPMIKGEGQKLLNVLDKIEKRLVKAEKQKHTDLENQLTTVQNKLFPNNSMQEREENFASYYANTGSIFFDVLKENLRPFSGEVLVFIEE